LSGSAAAKEQTRLNITDTMLVAREKMGELFGGRTTWDSTTASSAASSGDEEGHSGPSSRRVNLLTLQA
jgi:hypothetical protein